jgi:hypothetical protein
MMMTFLTDKVAEVLRAHAGPGVPDVFRRIRHAEMDDTGTITADVVMFDGLLAAFRSVSSTWPDAYRGGRVGCTWPAARALSKTVNGFGSTSTAIRCCRCSRSEHDRRSPLHGAAEF